MEKKMRYFFYLFIITLFSTTAKAQLENYCIRDSNQLIVFDSVSMRDIDIFMKDNAERLSNTKYYKELSIKVYYHEKKNLSQANKFLFDASSYVTRKYQIPEECRLTFLLIDEKEEPTGVPNFPCRGLMAITRIKTKE